MPMRNPSSLQDESIRIQEIREVTRDAIFLSRMLRSSSSSPLTLTVNTTGMTATFLGFLGWVLFVVSWAPSLSSAATLIIHSLYNITSSFSRAKASTSATFPSSPFSQVNPTRRSSPLLFDSQGRRFSLHRLKIRYNLRHEPERANLKYQSLCIQPYRCRFDQSGDCRQQGKG